MRRNALFVAAALAVQVILVGAIPLHETIVRATGRTVIVSVDPVDPYDPLRGYHANFTYRHLGPHLPGFDRAARDGSTAWAVLQAPHPGEAAVPVAIVRSPAAGRGDSVLRVHYRVVDEEHCSSTLRAAGCRTLRAGRNAWYADEASVAALSEALRGYSAVAELRLTADGDASLLRLTPSGGAKGLKR
ncbi:MAG: hypothetical protein JWM87_4182 [Candidatus Eremiobacteraeota bacterium]|nr:hypothetical protein [Candidatus Eremiobacteraeota bacterium]